ncbi:MAG: glycosyl transferase family protein [Sulfuricellaceae bacterium]|nr:glycosyl transferase family protein [Sulfuricellaceae bacterium]
MMSAEHPFAQYIRILGKGKNGSRALTQEEAFIAMKMILADEVEPMQLGAFLMLMRVKEETPEELAGFVKAARASLKLPAQLPKVDLDWSSYAGKRRQLPWFLLSALLLASSGIRVIMHGIGGRKDDRVYTPEALSALGFKSCESLEEAAQEVEGRNFAFIHLKDFSPKLDEIIELRPILGLRSPVHTLSRMVNPFDAPAMLQGIFHPGYQDTHQATAVLLNQPHVAVLKGDGGEIERNPDAECLVKTVHNGIMGEEIWPPMFSGQRHLRDETMDIARLTQLWNGDIEDEYGHAAVIGTAAIALKLMGKADSIESALSLATKLWDGRSVAWLKAAA